MNRAVKHLKDNFYGRLFKISKFLVRRCYPRYSVELPQSLNHEPIIYIGHHQNLFGPFITLLWFPRSVHTWILHVFLNRKACYQHYMDYTFTTRLGWNPVLAKICAYPVSYVFSHLLTSSRGIPVYRGSRKIVTTFKDSIQVLAKGESIAIFPDTDYSNQSSQTNDMYTGFLSLEKYYVKEMNKHIGFVPLYVSKSKRKIVAGDPIYFRDEIEFNKEKMIVHEKIQKELNRLAGICGDL